MAAASSCLLRLGFSTRSIKLTNNKEQIGNLLMWHFFNRLRRLIAASCDRGCMADTDDDFGDFADAAPAPPTLSIASIPPSSDRAAFSDLLTETIYWPAPPRQLDSTEPGSELTLSRSPSPRPLSASDTGWGEQEPFTLQRDSLLRLVTQPSTKNARWIGCTAIQRHYYHAMGAEISDTGVVQRRRRKSDADASALAMLSEAELSASIADIQTRLALLNTSLVDALEDRDNLRLENENKERLVVNLLAVLRNFRDKPVFVPLPPPMPPSRSPAPDSSGRAIMASARAYLALRTRPAQTKARITIPYDLASLWVNEFRGAVALSTLLTAITADDPDVFAKLCNFVNEML